MLFNTRINIKPYNQTSHPNGSAAETVGTTNIGSAHAIVRGAGSGSISVTLSANAYGIRSTTSFAMVGADATAYSVRVRNCTANESITVTAIAYVVRQRYVASAVSALLSATAVSDVLHWSPVPASSGSWNDVNNQSAVWTATITPNTNWKVMN